MSATLRRRFLAKIPALMAITSSDRALWGFTAASPPKREDFETFVKDRLVDLGRDTISIQAQLASTTGTLGEVAATLAKCEASVGSDADLATVNRTLDEIKKILQMS